MFIAFPTLPRKHWATIGCPEIGQIGQPILYTRNALRALKISWSDMQARDGLQWIMKKHNYSLEHPLAGFPRQCLSRKCSWFYIISLSSYFSIFIQNPCPHFLLFKKKKNHVQIIWENKKIFDLCLRDEPWDGNADGETFGSWN